MDQPTKQLEAPKKDTLWEAFTCPRWIRVSVAIILLWALFLWLDSGPLSAVRASSLTAGEWIWRGALYWASVAWFGCLILAKNKWVRWTALVLGSVAIAHDRFFYLIINGSGYNYHEIFLAMANPSNGWDAIILYILYAVPIYTLCFVMLVAWAMSMYRWLVRIPTLVAVTSSLVMIPVICVMAYYEGYGPGGQVATPFRVPLATAYFAFKPVIPRHIHREGPYFLPQQESRADHIILILDESVLGSHMELNGYVRGTNPGLLGLVDEGRAKSMGICSSACNYSIGSFFSIFSGMTPELMKEDCGQMFTRPSLFAYANQAGYQMGFLNSQDYARRLRDAKKQFGASLQIDSADSETLKPPWRLDHSLIPKVAEQIRSHPRTLTIIAKRGVHFPYCDKCPPEHIYYLPCLTKAVWSQNFVESVNSYDNALRWTMDNYLCKLYEALETTGKSVLVVYTSDHGQIIPGEKIPGFKYKRTHGMLNSPTHAVADVPLILMATPEAKPLLAAVRESNIDQASHFDLFPSLLWLMGYTREQIGPVYGCDLWMDDPNPSPREFFEGQPINAWYKFIVPDYTDKFNRIPRQ